MNLKYITTKACPICGCTEVIHESVESWNYSGKNTIREHASGGRWEHRHFLCGKKIHYIPNFRKEEFDGRCENDPEVIALLKKNEEDQKKLKEFMKENNINPWNLRKVASDWN